jgi:cytochrome c oxidase subunit 3
MAHAVEKPAGIWSGGPVSPFGASWGKLMMWFFLISDAFSFSGLLIAYGLLRFTHEHWPNPEEVFHAFPGFGHQHLPLVFVGLMTFILIVSSFTMVMAVEAGHRNDKGGILFWLMLTIVGGLAFLGCQAWEWTHLIMGGTTIYGNPYGPDGHGAVAFGQLFFLITGFHGGHVTSGVIINIIIFYNVMYGVYDNRPPTPEKYEIVEKVGLYWHFVDLVWVFVFTFFYLV